MRSLILAFVLIVEISAVPVGQNSELVAKGSEKVNFCDLVEHPETYNGRDVIFTAEYGAGPEGSVFFDDTCKRTTPDQAVSALATFSKTNYKFGSPLDKKLMKILKKTDRVQVTVSGTFVDGKSRIFGHQMCCRYKIEVQELLDVVPPKSTRDK